MPNTKLHLQVEALIAGTRERIIGDIANLNITSASALHSIKSISRIVF